MRPVPDELNWFTTLAGVVGTLAWVWNQARKLRARHATRTEGGLPRSRSDYLLGSSYALLCAAIWSASFVSLSYVARTQSAITANIVILGAAALFLFLGSMIAQARDSRRGISSESVIRWRSTLGLGLVAANLGNFVLSILALRFISASQAMALTNTYPLMLVVALMVGRRRPFAVGTILTVCLVILGVWLTNASGSFELLGGNAGAGTAIALLAGCSFALWIYLVEGIEATYRRPATRMRLLSIVFFASFALLVSWSWLSDPRPVFTRQELLILSLNGLRVAVVYVLFQAAVRKAGALLSAVLSVSQVMLTFVWDKALLGTAITAPLVVGGLLIVLGAISLLADELRSAQLRPATLPVAAEDHSSDHFQGT